MRSLTASQLSAQQEQPRRSQRGNRTGDRADLGTGAQWLQQVCHNRSLISLISLHGGCLYAINKDTRQLI